MAKRAGGGGGSSGSSGNKRQQSRRDADDLNRWYESVDADATPDDVFWEEMERQRLQNRLVSSTTSIGLTSDPQSLMTSSSVGGQGYGPGGRISPATVMTAMPPSAPYLGSSGGSSGSATQGGGGGAAGGGPKLSTEATLNEYAAFAVPDNWLDEELVWIMSQDDDDAEEDESNRRYVLQNGDKSADWEDEGGADDDDAEIGEGGADDASWMRSSEPWDQWATTSSDQGNDDSSSSSPSDAARLMRQSASADANEFVLDADTCSEDDETERQQQQQQQEEEAEYRQRLSTITISSARLERARDNAKAAAFFAQAPDVVEGYDRCFVAAIDNACFKNLKGNLRNYGIQFLDNFGDYRDNRVEDLLEYTIEEIASFKARQVYEVTGLPCIASRTSWEIEPIPNFNTGGGATASISGKPSALSSSSSSLANVSPRVASGYRFNDVGMHVDYISDALRPVSEPSRVTQFKTCLCYYDGTMEVYDYGVAEIDLVYCNSLRTFIPVSAAINEMVKTLELTFGLEFQPWLKKRVDGAASGAFGSAASMKLRDRVLKEGRVLPNDIIDVSSFMDSMVDVELMDECAKELSNRFFDSKPNKVITVATTGLVIALPIAKYLQVPLVYARKERNVVMADTYKASYSSKTVGKNRELLVSRDHLDEDDRVLVVDDFLSSGSSQEALLRIVAESGATAVGVGVLLEKVYESGRQSLSGFNVPIQSLCRVASLQSGVIQLVEEEGYDRMNQKKLKSSLGTK